MVKNVSFESGATVNPCPVSSLVHVTDDAVVAQVYPSFASGVPGARTGSVPEPDV
ncbi:hypothetical protein GS463_01105 [Rhodococcus hoagii]|nr:hypothetical protein [Prescottella equi]